MTVDQFESKKWLSCEIRALTEARETYIKEPYTAAYRKALDIVIARRMLEEIEVKQIAASISEENPREVVTAYMSAPRNTFDDIAYNMHYSLRQISRFYQTGINELIEKGILTADELTQTGRKQVENSPETRCEIVSESA